MPRARQRHGITSLSLKFIPDESRAALGTPHPYDTLIDTIGCGRVRRRWQRDQLRSRLRIIEGGVP
jgi:hypothetical protein